MGLAPKATSRDLQCHTSHVSYHAELCLPTELRIDYETRTCNEGTVERIIALHTYDSVVFYDHETWDASYTPSLLHWNTLLGLFTFLLRLFHVILTSHFH